MITEERRDRDQLWSMKTSTRRIRIGNTSVRFQLVAPQDESLGKLDELTEITSFGFRQEVWVVLVSTVGFFLVVVVDKGCRVLRIDIFCTVGDLQ